MENASKALIIAGAILLSILLISLGIAVYQQAKSTTSSSNLDSTQIEAFNSKWDTYTTRTQTASDIRSMISALVAHNSTEANSGDERYINVSCGEKESNEPETAVKGMVSELEEGLKNGTRYKVTAEYSDEGLLNKLNVQVAGGTTTTPSGSDS